MFDIKHNFLCNREKIERKVTFDLFDLHFSDLRLIFGSTFDFEFLCNRALVSYEKHFSIYSGVL